MGGFLQFFPQLDHDPDDNAKFISINRAHINALAVRSGEEALHLLCRSERILDDLELALEDPTRWTQHLVIRKWADMPLSSEWRGFVCDGKLTALSQYFAPCYFEELQSEHVQRQVVSKCKVILREGLGLSPISLLFPL